MTDMWCRDSEHATASWTATTALTHYDTQADCEKDLPGLTCMRNISLSASSQWDARSEIAEQRPPPRKLYTHDSTADARHALIDFTDPANIATLQAALRPAADRCRSAGSRYLTQAQNIVANINGKTLGDIFHSDIAYVGAAAGGQELPEEPQPAANATRADKADDPDCFENLLDTQGADPDVADSGRLKVIYVGSNDGILHCMVAPRHRQGGGSELWGFIPDEVLPSLKKIVVDNEYTFTVDGRMTAEDIYYRGGTDKFWKTILVFGLKDGGDSFYALDATP